MAKTLIHGARQILPGTITRAALHPDIISDLDRTKVRVDFIATLGQSVFVNVGFTAVMEVQLFRNGMLQQADEIASIADGEIAVTTPCYDEELITFMYGPEVISDESLATKADKTELALKANITDMTAALALKADAADIEALSMDSLTALIYASL